MRLHLIRHVVTAETGKRLSSADPGIRLSPKGEAMALGLADHLAGVGIAAVYSSPIERCRQTVAPLTSPARFRFPDGETLSEVQWRAVAAVEQLATTHASESVAVGSHADVIRVILANYLGTPLDLIHRINVLPASVSIVDLSPSGEVAVPVVNHVSDPGRWG